MLSREVYPSVDYYPSFYANTLCTAVVVVMHRYVSRVLDALPSVKQGIA